MDILEKREHYISLFDFYQNILTEKQQQYFKDYYFDDLSLAEIALNYGVSRNAVFDQLQKIHKILEDYEIKLELYKKYTLRNEVLEAYSNSKDENILKLIEKLKEIE